jgi:hypothetical protein
VDGFAAARPQPAIDCPVFSRPSKITLKKEKNPPFGGLSSVESFDRVRPVKVNVSVNDVTRVGEPLSVCMGPNRTLVALNRFSFRERETV